MAGINESHVDPPSKRLDQTAVRLSAQRALLGAITPDVRMICVSDDGRVIAMTVFAARELDADAADALSVAATEIIADFPDRDLRETTIVEPGPLPRNLDPLLTRVYQRAEF